MSHLVVIGAQRCGTTYLTDVLESHPRVSVATPRRPEPKVFLDPHAAERGRDHYLRTFFTDAAVGDLLVEKSTSYLDHPESGPRMRQVLGDVRVLVQLRDPVTRAVSHWRFSTSHGVETRPLAEALEESLVREQDWDRDRFSVSPFAYLSRGRYAEAVRPWQELFGDRLRVQFLEELTSGPHQVAELFDWVGLPAPADVPREPSNDSSGDAPVLDPDLRARLRAHFAADDAALRDLTARALPWDEE